jgi:hypothetical protein
MTARQPRTGRLARLTALLLLSSGLFTVVSLAADDEPRRRPGPPPVSDPAVNPGGIPLPLDMPPEAVPVPDRWRILDSLGQGDRLLDPYAQNTLKADKPVFDDWFVSINAISDSIYEPRSVPTPVGVQSSRDPDSNDLFGGVEQQVLAHSAILNLTIVKGRTAYRPPDYEFRLTPVWQVNHVRVKEDRVLYADPERGAVRRDQHVGLQELLLDYHIRNVSDRYDFDSIRVGIQPFNADFRGFLFQDSQLGIRLFGNRNNNLWQYNLAWFRRMEKETNSGLNTLAEPIRRDDVFVANLYRQDFPIVGLTTQGTILWNRNRERPGPYFDRNGFQVRPAVQGDQRPRVYDVGYLGLNIDGHIGRANLTASAYFAAGRDRNSSYTGNPANIRAWLVAAEPSYDLDWVRIRASALYASGDRDPYDNRETGFDAIFENPQFAGSDTSYWIRQSIPLIGGGGVALSPRNGLLPSLRPSKEQGQSNFTNPGLLLLGGGADLDLLPELRLSLNANYMWFDRTESLQALRMQGDIPRPIGADLSAALIWRPWFIQNAVVRLSGAALLPGGGFRSLYEDGGRTDAYYSVLTNLVLSY